MILTGRQLMDGALQGSRYPEPPEPLPADPSDRTKSVVAHVVYVLSGWLTAGLKKPILFQNTYP